MVFADSIPVRALNVYAHLAQQTPDGSSQL